MSKIKANAPTDSQGKQYHLSIGAGDVGTYAIITGDTDRPTRIGQQLDKVEELAYHREYRTVRGEYKGLEVSATSTGIGCPPSEIAINELYKVGIKTIVRVGTIASISDKLNLGDIVIPIAVMRKGGTASNYVKDGFPAYANSRVTFALIQAAKNLGISYTVGVTYSTNSFYIGQARPVNADGTGYWPSWADKLIPDLQQARILGMDIDTAGELIVSHLHGIRMGAVLAVNANRLTDEWADNGGEEKAIAISLEALKILAEQEKQGKW